MSSWRLGPCALRSASQSDCDDRRDTLGAAAEAETAAWAVAILATSSPARCSIDGCEGEDGAGPDRTRPGQGRGSRAPAVGLGSTLCERAPAEAVRTRHAALALRAPHPTPPAPPPAHLHPPARPRLMAPVQDDVEAGRAPALQHPLEHADLNKILPAGTPARSKMPLADEDAAAVSSALPRFAASHAGPDGGDFSMAGLAPSVRASGAGVSRQVTDSSESDPLLLRSRLVGEGELRRRAQSVRGSRGRNASNAVQQFYLRQNSHIEDLLRPLSAYVAEDAEATCANSFKVKIGIYGSITANVVLASLQLYAAASSASLSLIATCVDSVFDPVRALLTCLVLPETNMGYRLPVRQSHPQLPAPQVPKC